MMMNNGNGVGGSRCTNWEIVYVPPKPQLPLHLQPTATSKEEWEEQCKLWPTPYHPLTYNIDGITGFSEEDLQLILTFMKFALDSAKSGAQVVNFVIVDPAQQVVASAHDEART